MEVDWREDPDLDQQTSQHPIKFLRFGLIFIVFSLDQPHCIDLVLDCLKILNIER